MQPENLYAALTFDHFPAQVLWSWVPELRDKPFVVLRQNPDSYKTTACACSPAAIRKGVKPGLPYRILKKRFPGLLPVPQNTELEQIARKEIAQILSQFSPDFTMKKFGSSLLDLTGTPCSRQMDPERIARKIRAQIQSTVGLQQVAVGIAHTRLTARLLAGSALPDGIRYCPPGNEPQVLAPFSTSILPGLSHTCRTRLKDYAIKTIGKLQQLSKEYLVSRFGAEGELLYGLARSVENESSPSPSSQEIRAETVFDKDVNDTTQLMNYIRLTADRFCDLLKSKNLQATRITCAIRYSDSRQIRKTAILQHQTDSYYDVTRLAQRMFFELYQRRVAIRSIVLSVSCPQKDTGQMDLFETTREKKQRAVAVGIRQVRHKMGFKAIMNASCLGVS